MTATVTAGPLVTTEAWRGFAGTHWRDRVDVRDFIQANYTPYEGDAGFLTGPTERTRTVWEKVSALFPEERQRGILDVDAATPSTITSHAPGYIDPDRELIVGLQTDAPLKRAIMPNGGLRMVENGLKAYGYEPDPFVSKVFGTYRKTHNDGVFDAYTAEMRAARKAGIITGLPDAYGRGRIIGDYRRVALYGTTRLIEAKHAERARLDAQPSGPSVIRDREELAEQIKALGELARMAATYGCDVTQPATTAHEAVQWLYLGFLAAVKEQNGAAMSLGRTSTFLDVYLQRDLDEGRIDETRAQELIDDFVIKLRIVRFLRTPEYDALFSGDPTWVTESIGGISIDGRPLVTRTSFRFLQTLYNLGPAPEPNLTVLWSPRLPAGFKRFCAQVSIDTSAIQYDGRRAGQPFAPGANPMNGRDRHGVAASALSVSKLPYEQARDGISLTTTITPEGLGHDPAERAGHLVGILDAYMASGGFHMNINVLDRATLEDAMEHPEKYPELTVRVSGYAVNFVRLTREQQLDVISRTFHGAL